MLSKFLAVAAAGRLASSVINFLSSVMIMEVLSVSDYGAFFIYSVVVMTVSMSFSAGINNAYMVGATKETAVQEFHEVVKIKAFFTMLAIFMALLCVLVQPEISVWAGAIIVGVLLSPCETFCLKYQTIGSVGKYAILLPVKNVIYYGVAFFCFVILDQNPEEFLLLLSVVLFGPAFILIVFWWLRTPAILRVKSWAIKSKNYFFQDAAALVIMRLDALVVAALAGSSLLTQKELGLYGACLTFSTPLAVLTSSLSAVLLPKNANGLKIKWAQTFKNILFLSVAGVTAVWFFIVAYILFFSAESDYYLVIWLSIPILSATVFSLMAMVFRVKCFHDKKEKSVTRVTLAQIPVILISYTFLGAFFGIWGCVVSFLLVRMVSLLWLFAIDKKIPEEVLS